MNRVSGNKPVNSEENWGGQSPGGGELEGTRDCREKVQHLGADCDVVTKTAETPNIYILGSIF